MKVGIVGLGLIGGSAAKAFKAAGHTVYGYDIDSTVLGYARLDGTIDKELAKNTLPQGKVFFSMYEGVYLSGVPWLSTKISMKWRTRRLSWGEHWENNAANSRSR